MSALLTLLVTLVVLAALPLPYAVGSGVSARRAPVTLLLLLANVVVFLATHVSLSRGLVEPLQAFNDYGVIPAAVQTSDLLTYQFLHVSGWHVVWNMLFLYLFGPSVEEKLGSWLYAALYLLGGMAAGLINSAIVMHFAANSSAAYEPVVGASGAISAVLGLFTIFAVARPLRLFWAMGLLTGEGRHRHHLLQIPAAYGIGLWLAQTLYGAAMSLIQQDAGGVAYFTHLGGFFVGIVLGLAANHVRDAFFPAPISSAPHQATTAGEMIGAGSPLGDRLPVKPGAGSGLVALLARAVSERDLSRAETLHAKCRAMNLAPPRPLLDQLEELRQGAPAAAADAPSGDDVVPSGI